MSSVAAVTSSNMVISPVRVKFGTVDLGGTLGNVTITTKYIKTPIVADQTGKTDLDYIVSGFECTVTTELAEVALMDNWKIVFPNATLIAGPPKAILFKANIGDADSAHSGLLNLHPLNKDATDLDFDWNFFNAVSTADSSFTYGPTEQGKIKVVWKILPDTSVSPSQFFRYGNLTSV